MMDGCGRYSWPDGRVYSGQYVLDQKHGFGVLSWTDGRRYEGFWDSGRQHGLGRLCSGSGRSCLALWERGERLAWRGEEEERRPSSSLQSRRSHVRISDDVDRT
uniref:MORN repeat-containing protein 5 n=2 Tax=Alexandrium monilatum TaxID=311494 RepID=A0A7S4Q7H9_9DINO